MPARVGKWIGAAATTIAREVREALREVTLKDLALAALPGIAGLLFFLATGVGLGHRQARFNFVIETAGALRLAPRGPLGVVGSDSFVHVNIRAAAPRPSGVSSDARKSVLPKSGNGTRTGMAPVTARPAVRW